MMLALLTTNIYYHSLREMCIVSKNTSVHTFRCILHLCFIQYCIKVMDAYHFQKAVHLCIDIYTLTIFKIDNQQGLTIGNSHRELCSIFYNNLSGKTA